MIGLGCTIGTGLFLGSAISVKLAGPAVILSFAAGALIALTVMWALAEMAVAHPDISREFLRRMGAELARTGALQSRAARW